MYKSYAVLAMIIGICCVQSVGAMELEKYSGGNKKDTAIDMHRFWSDEYRNDVSKIERLDLKNMRSGFKKEEYLPLGAKGLDHLLYLSTIQKNDTKTLFTQTQQHKFNTAEITRRLVPWVFGINAVIIVGTSLLPLTNLAALSQCSNITVSDCLSQIATIMIPTGSSISGNFLLGFSSWYATGLSTYFAACTADDAQDEMGHLSHKYATIAKCLIDIHFENEKQARWIADKFDIEKLKQRARLKTYKTKVGNDLVRPLEEALHFIKYNNLLVRFTEIENYIYNKRHSRHIELFERRIDLLEKMTHEQSAEIERLKQKYEEK